eukprot:GFKZ01013962.1.p1 GENE.GFKZ01013962.1~~GFKZ01013962.1.p1  ORF type:complete len:507 (-),score=68.04 GFKZ01013962.1:1260-2780(-)
MSLLPSHLPFRRPPPFHPRLFSSNPCPATNPTPTQHSDHTPVQDSPPTPPPHSPVRSPRRLPDSPILPLESVALPPSLIHHVSSLIKRHSLTPRDIRFLSKPNDRIIAPETALERRKPHLGNPRVQPPPSYSLRHAIAHTTVRAPATLTANVYVMSELQRRLKSLQPKSILDFGAGIGVGVMALGRVFSRLGHVQREAVLVDEAKGMTELVDSVLKHGGEEVNDIRVRVHRDLKRVGEKDSFDIVLASYSLNEIVRKALALPNKVGEEHSTEKPFTRDSRTKLAERRLKKTVLELWTRVEEGGVLMVVEDGTAAGFEVVLFVRELILAMGDGNHVNIVAPCLHSKSCPLNGTVTRHRVCRFIQRFNRPPFLRQNRPQPDGFQDEYFSYIILQKPGPHQLLNQHPEPQLHVTHDNDEAASNEREGEIEPVLAGDNDVESGTWGRLIRAPLRRSKHIALDFCTSDGTLERRIVTRRNSGQAYFARARRSKWGDVWSSRPKAKPHPLNF